MKSRLIQREPRFVFMQKQFETQQLHARKSMSDERCHLYERQLQHQASPHSHLVLSQTVACFRVDSQAASTAKALAVAMQLVWFQAPITSGRHTVWLQANQLWSGRAFMARNLHEGIHARSLTSVLIGT